MKGILLILLICSKVLVAQDPSIVWAKVNARCALRPHPNDLGMTVVQHMYKSEECIVMDIVKGNSLTEEYWWYVITLEGNMGYVAKPTIDLPDSIFVSMRDSKDFEARIANAKDYHKANSTVFIDTAQKRKQRLLTRLKQELTKAKDELSKYRIVIDHISYEGVLGYPNWKIDVINTNKTKIVKYLWFTVAAINPVDDIVQAKTFECVGPIQPFSKSEYLFENAFISKVVDHCVIKTVKIQYMDKSTIVLSGKQLKTGDLSSIDSTSFEIEIFK